MASKFVGTGFHVSQIASARIDKESVRVCKITAFVSGAQIREWDVKAPDPIGLLALVNSYYLDVLAEYLPGVDAISENVQYTGAALLASRSVRGVLSSGGRS